MIIDDSRFLFFFILGGEKWPRVNWSLREREKKIIIYFFLEKKKIVSLLSLSDPYKEEDVYLMQNIVEFVTDRKVDEGEGGERKNLIEKCCRCCKQKFNGQARHLLRPGIEALMIVDFWKIEKSSKARNFQGI